MAIGDTMYRQMVQLELGWKERVHIRAGGYFIEWDAESFIKHMRWLESNVELDKLFREYFTLLASKHGEDGKAERMLELRKQIYKSMGIEVIKDD